jgi:hypothetical protein
MVPPQAAREGQNAIAALGDLKPMLVGAYAEGDQITVAAGGNMLTRGMSGLLKGDILGMMGGQFSGGPGRRQRERIGVR